MGNVSIEYSVGGANRSELSLLASPVSCGLHQNCSDFELVVSPRFAFWKAGSATVLANPGAVLFSPAGLVPFEVHSITPSTRRIATAGQISPKLVLNLGNGPVGISTSQVHATVASVRNQLDVARRAEESLLRERFGVARMGEGMAVKAAAMWTTISTPAENGGGA